MHVHSQKFLCCNSLPFTLAFTTKEFSIITVYLNYEVIKDQVIMAS